MGGMYRRLVTRGWLEVILGIWRFPGSLERGPDDEAEMLSVILVSGVDGLAGK